MKNKILALLLALALCLGTAFALTACGGDDKPDDKKQEEEEKKDDEKKDEEKKDEEEEKKRENDNIVNLTDLIPS